MSLTECPGPRRVPRSDGGDDVGVVRVHPVDELDGFAGGAFRFVGVARGQAHQHIDEQLQDRVFRLLRQRDVELFTWRVQTGLPLLFGTQHATQPLDSGLVDPFGGQRSRQRFEHQARVEQVTQCGAQVLQIDDDGAGRRAGIGLADEQPALGSAAHPGNLVVLDESNSLPQHRSAHFIALLQRVLGAQRFSDGPAAAHNVRLDLAGDLRCSFVRWAGIAAHPQQVSNMHPATGPPPTETTPTSGRCDTCRSPASPRNCRQPSCSAQ